MQVMLSRLFFWCASALTAALVAVVIATPVRGGGPAISIGMGAWVGPGVWVPGAPYTWWWGDPYWAGPIYWPYYDPMLLRVELERMERLRWLREAAGERSPPQAPGNLWDGGAGPWGYVKRIPPPTPESEIQPAYRGASQIRPEYQRSGESMR